MIITTRQGDGGETGLIGSTRLSKSHPRVCAMGDIDELVANLGLARVHCQSAVVALVVKTVQYQLFNVGSSLATPDKSCKTHALMVTNNLLAYLDSQVDRFKLKEGEYDWSVPGDRADVTYFELARTVCRRAERTVVSLKESGEYVNPLVIQYLNRLSDLLWLLGRWLEKGD